MRNHLILGIFGLTLAFLCIGTSGSAADIAAGAPPGFTCLGSVLPDDLGMLKKIPPFIEKQKLTEMDYADLKRREVWGIETSPLEQERGYIVYARHYLDNIYPFSVPNNRVDKLAVFASPDEYEPITFAVYGLKDIKGLKVTVSDLADGQGNILRKDNFDVRTVRSLPFLQTEKEYARKPVLLEKRTAVDISAKTSAWFWLTAYVPRSGQPGIYTGTISLAAPETKPYELKLSVNILPVKLLEPDVLNGMCFLIAGLEDQHPENLAKYMVDMKAHGMNSVWTWPDFGVEKVDGKVVCDFSKFAVTRHMNGFEYFGNSLEDTMNAYKKAGFTKPWICGSADTFGELVGKINPGAKAMTPEFDRDFLEIAGQVVAHGREKGWPSFFWHVIDEPSYNRAGTMEYSLYYNALLKKNFPEFKTFEDIGSEDDEPLLGTVDILAYAGPMRKNLDNCRKAGAEFWIYNHGGWGVYNRADRICRGSYTWKIKAKGNYDWVYTYWLGEPKAKPTYYDTLLCEVVPAPDGPLPTVSWEGVREGIDDLKYIYTLDQLIQAARASDKAELKTEAAAAEAELKDLLKDAPGFEEGWDKFMAQIPGIDFDLNRWAIAQDIIRLDKMLSGRPVPRRENPLLPKSDAHTLGLWHFDEESGDAVNDAEPDRNRPGQFIQLAGKTNPARVEGKSGRALQFSATTNPVLLPLKKGINPTGFTFEAWINYSETRPEASYIACAEKWRWLLRLRPGGVLNFVINNQGKPGQELESKPISPNQWHHVAATYDGALMKLYVDGKFDASFASPGAIAFVAAPPSITIGGTGAENEGFFIGKIDEVRLSDTAREFTASLPWE